MTARTHRPIFTVRMSLLALGIAAAGLAFPSVSTAATVPCSRHSQASCQIKTTPVAVGSQGFKLTLLFIQGTPTGYGGRYPNSVAGVLFKHSGKATENDNYAFSGGGSHPVRFKAGTKPLQYAKITGTFAHNGGSMNLTFHATGPVSRVKVPKGCSGHGGERRSGKLTGSYKLNADKLGTITHKSFKATISTADYTCSPATHGYDVETDGYSPAWVDVFKNKAGSVSEEFDVQRGGSNGWAFDNRYTASGLPSPDYTHTSNLNSATVTGGGGITGRATYKGGSGTGQTHGKMSGSLAAPFFSLGNIAAFPNGKSRYAMQSRS